MVLYQIQRISVVNEEGIKILIPKMEFISDLPEELIYINVI